MKILIIGGTKFLGRHLIKAALERHHTVTLFNRGKYSSEAFENVEQIAGDRNVDLDKLNGRNWDAVIDTCGYLPSSVRASAKALKESAGQYVLISSISAYRDFSRPDFDETAPLAELNDEQLKRLGEFDRSGEVNAFTLGDLYGGAKALCEKEVETIIGRQSLIIRSGLIVGAFDTTDRFTYWVKRVAAGGEVLAPGAPDRFVQVIDARDMSEWIIKMIECAENGIFHATGKPFDLTMQKMLEEIKAVSQSDAAFTWVSEEFLKQENVGAWSEMPLYLPESNEASKGFLAVNIDKAQASGLEFRPLSETIKDVLAWGRTKTGELKAGITSEREKELLQKWHDNP